MVGLEEREELIQDRFISLGLFQSIDSVAQLVDDIDITSKTLHPHLADIVPTLPTRSEQSHGNSGPFQ